MLKKHNDKKNVEIFRLRSSESELKIILTYKEPSLSSELADEAIALSWLTEPVATIEARVKILNNFIFFGEVFLFL